jgi:hypothetical protein
MSCRAIGEDYDVRPVIGATPVKKKIPSEITHHTMIGGVMYGHRTMPVVVTEDYLADEERCWGITYTTDYHRSTATSWGM